MIPSGYVILLCWPEKGFSSSDTEEDTLSNEVTLDKDGDLVLDRRKNRTGMLRYSRFIVDLVLA